MIKKQTALITVLIMLFSAINVSFVYSAPVQGFYADFDEYSPGAFGKSAGKNGTGSKLYSSWFSIVNEANGNTTDSYINRTDNVTKTECCFTDFCNNITLHLPTGKGFIFVLSEFHFTLGKL